MISDIRKQFQSPFYRATLWVGIIALTGIFSIPSMLRNGSQSPWAIRVNDVEIGGRQFKRAVSEKREWLSQVRAYYGDQADIVLSIFGINSDPVEMALDALIKESLWDDVARKIGFQLHYNSVLLYMNNPAFVKNYLANIVPPFLISADGALNVANLKHYLARSGIKPKEFDAELERTIERKIVQDIFSAALYVPSFALSDANQSKRSLAVLSFSRDAMLQKEKRNVISEDDLVAFYTAHKNEPQYSVEEKRSGKKWSFTPEGYGISISDKEILDSYEAQKERRYIKSPTMIEVRIIRMKDNNRIGEVYKEVVQEPGAFAEFAKKYSEDADSASRGGLIKPFARGEHEEQFERAAFLLRKNGDISPVVSLNSDFVIIQRKGIIAKEFTPVGEVRKEIAQQLLRNKLSQQIATDFKKIKNIFNKDKTGFESFVREKNGTESVLYFGASNESPCAKTLFSIKNKEGLSLCSEGETVALIELTSIEKARVSDLSEVKDIIRENIIADRVHQELEGLRQAIQSDESRTSYSEINKKYGGNVLKIPLITGVEISDNKDFKRLGIDAAMLDVLEYSGLGRIIHNNQGIHVIYVTDKEVSSEVKDALSQDVAPLIQRENKLIADSFVASLRRNATIKTNESIINI